MVEADEEIVAEPEVRPAKSRIELDSKMIQFDLLADEVRVKSLQLPLARHTERPQVQAAIDSKINEQHEIGRWLGDYFDHEIQAVHRDLEDVRFSLWDDVQETPVSRIEPICRQLAKLERRRLLHWQLARRVARMAGRGPIGAISHRFPNGAVARGPDAFEWERIRDAVLGYAGSDGRGKGQRSTWGGVPANIQGAS